MRAWVSRIFASLLGGVVGSLIAAHINASYISIFREWEQHLRTNPQLIPGVYQEAKELASNFQIINLHSNIIAFSFIVLGYLCYPIIDWGLKHLQAWVYTTSGKISRQKFTAGVLGFFGGVLLALLITTPAFYLINRLPPSIFNAPAVMLLAYVLILLLLGYVGGFTAITIFFPPSKGSLPGAIYLSETNPRILDSSVLIDGRIAEILRTGFLPGPIIITSSVIHELQLIADSPDRLKRAKGRRGLEILKGIQDSALNPVHIFEDNTPELARVSVDDRIIHVAQQLNAEVVTTDYNLNRVAAIFNVRVLNINELANAVKPMLIPGDTLHITILKGGKEPGQGVGYLEDGTMVVVEGGASHIGVSCEVEVTSIMQTAAGRLIFARISKVS